VAYFWSQNEFHPSFLNIRKRKASHSRRLLNSILKTLNESKISIRIRLSLNLWQLKFIFRICNEHRTLPFFNVTHKLIRKPFHTVSHMVFICAYQDVIFAHSEAFSLFLCLMGAGSCAKRPNRPKVFQIYLSNHLTVFNPKRHVVKSHS
jgi:hypothetical protein